MPYYRRTYRPRRRYRRRAPGRVPGLATRPRMMPRTLALKRHNQVSTRVMWFKYNAILNARGSEFNVWRANGPELLDISQFRSMLDIYDQYKVLGFKIKLFPSNVGIEPHDSLLGTDYTLFRGNHIVWSDQRLDPTLPDPISISQVINTASAKMINPRRPYTRSLYRPRGQPEWGATTDLPPPYPPVPTAKVDPWSGCICHFYQDASGPPPASTPDTPLFFYTIQYKVLFRGRRQD